MASDFTAHLQAREDFILPDILPASYTHRVIVHDRGEMTWRWHTSLPEAQQHLARVAEASWKTWGWDVRVLGRDEAGRITNVEVHNQSRRFSWNAKFKQVLQWVEHPVASDKGHGDGYWRKCRPALTATVMSVINKYKNKPNI